MPEFERCVVISNAEYANLVATNNEAEILKRFLHKKLKSYAGIDHNELEDICVMLHIIEPKDDEA